MKIVLITGATSGIGRATAEELAKQAYHVVFIARNREKAETVRNAIINSAKNENVDYILADLTSKNQIRECAETFKKRFQKLDILINNAGVCLPERRITPDGFEESFQINYLSHFMLSNLLLGLLRNSDDPRIVNVSSAGHASGKFEPDNLQSQKKFGGFSTYCNTKLLNLLFSFELAERVEGSGITVNALHPGLVNTNFANEFKGILGRMANFLKPFFLTAQKGAATSVYLSTSDEVRGVTGKYFVKCKPAVTRSQYLTRENRKILWEKSLELSGL